MEEVLERCYKSVERIEDLEAAIKIEKERLGNSLYQLHKVCPHGEYMHSVRRLGLSQSAAKRLVNFKTRKNVEFSKNLAIASAKLG